MLAAIRSEAELRSLEAASFNPRMLRRFAAGARATLLTATDFTIADGIFGRLETPLLRRTPRKIDQPISIVFETEQIAGPFEIDLLRQDLQATLARLRAARNR